MVTPWANWKPFPDPRCGEHLDAPIGPGVFEVRHTETGEQIAFAHSGNVAHSLARLLPQPASGLRSIFRRRNGLNHRSHELEYRTCSAGTVHEAKIVADRLIGRRSLAMRRRMSIGPL